MLSKYNVREKLPTGKDSCIIWEGNNFNSRKNQLSYDGTYTITDGIVSFNAIDCEVYNANTGELISKYFFQEDVTKKPSISLKAGQILLLELGASLR